MSFNFGGRRFRDALARTLNRDSNEPQPFPTPDGQWCDEGPEATLVVSMLEDDPNMHMPALDLDGMEVFVVPSSTPGNYHLYINRPMTWQQYKRLMKVMVDVGLVQRGYYDASVRRGYSALRTPWTKKGQADGVSTY
jgi:hypothetical protein